MKTIPLSIIAASTMAMSQIAYAGVTVSQEDCDLADEKLVNEITDTLAKNPDQVTIDQTLTSAFAVDGKIDGFSVSEFLANSGFESSDLEKGTKSVACCHTNCHSNCHSNCHGSRSWR
ncbi:hypothetical protein LMH73_021295 [Vibrio splendidus]|nr:hypothetical protein [Vibrio splendidus]MCC4880366.1 hypothetical protein [Vibrio splendidus]